MSADQQHVPKNLVLFPPQAPPKFDPVKHNILSSELKHLYTAVTRARKTLVIFDASEKYRYGVQKYWEAKQLVRVRRRTKA